MLRLQKQPAMKNKKLVVLLMLAMGCNPLIVNNNADGGPGCDTGEVRATLSSVTLAQDCPDPDPQMKTDFVSGACAQDGVCPSLCRQSSMQLSFDSSQLTPAKIDIRAVRVLDVNTRQVLDTLSHRLPTQWKIDKYVTWDETVPAEVALKTSYKLSAPKYDTFGEASRLAYPQTFIVEVDVAIDGVVQTLSIEAQREPEVVT